MKKGPDGPGSGGTDQTEGPTHGKGYNHGSILSLRGRFTPHAKYLSITETEETL